MKKFLSLLFICFTGLVFADTYPSKVKSVIVYQTRAEVTRSVRVPLGQGEQELVFSGISSFADQSNIQVRGTGDLVILGISFRQNYLNENQLPEELQEIKNQMEALEYEIKKINNAMAALTSEDALLTANQQIGGRENGMSLENLQAVSSYYRERLNEIADERLEHQTNIDARNEEYRRLSAHYNDRTAQFRNHSGEIVVNVDVKNATTANLELIYMVSNVGWTAEYDIRSADVDEPLAISYKAVVTQNTGENWEDVQLTLSTGNPNAGIIIPDLNPQYLDFYSYIGYGVREQTTRAYSNDMRQAAPMAEAYDMEDEILVSSIDVSSETRTMYTNYTVERPYSLASGEKPLTVVIREQQVEADYEYQAVPKLRPRVFLVAKAKNWGELVLLPGPINIFFEGGYVGKSYMDPNVTSDDLPISLGYDPGITIERNLVTDLSSRRIIGSNRRETMVYEIVIRNNKSKDIQVRILDQVPISQNSEIKVENVEVGNGTLDEMTGEVNWMVNLSPGQQVTKTLSFDVKYPKNQTISGL